MIKRLKQIIRDNSGSLFLSRTSFAQEAEDLVLDKMIDGRKSGFYVEVGCHHPFRFSNTYYFYRRGWKGICIDPLPGTKKLFTKWRSRDLVIEMGVSEQPSLLTYYMFDEPALNTFNPELAKERNGLEQYRITGTLSIATDTLQNILDQHLEENQKIDFFSIDVEGLDLEVLRSNDWKKYRPQIVVTECLEADMINIQRDPVAHFLIEMGYAPYAKTGYSVIFMEKP